MPDCLSCGLLCLLNAPLPWDCQAAAARQQFTWKRKPKARCNALPPLAGFGDTAASAVGSLYGRRRLCPDTNKTWEGTAAAVVTTLAAWAALAALGSAALGSAGAAAAGLALLQQPGVWLRLAGVTALSCLLEGVTTQLDNVFMPLHYFALLLCL